MPASKDGTRRIFSATYKVGVLDELAKEGGPTQAELAAKHGVGANLIWSWKSKETKLRKLAAREAKVNAKGLTNGETSHAAANGNGHAKVKPAEDNLPGLRITGLTPLIKALVAEEVQKVIAGIVTTQLGDVVAKQISKRFADN